MQSIKNCFENKYYWLQNMFDIKALLFGVRDINRKGFHEIKSLRIVTFFVDKNVIDRKRKSNKLVIINYTIS